MPSLLLLSLIVLPIAPPKDPCHPGKTLQQVAQEILKATQKPEVVINVN